ncbi:MAG: LemA family protein [Saprospiraceae bacterium]|nr:LemA family protein [Saprospiraceae bacterium]MCB9326152.1 LemA family protein [Lewinellaceae bacterium]
MRSLTVTVVIVVLGLILLMSGCNNYNKFVDMEENVENAWGKVQSAYQRRADLIPNLVNTVKGAAAHERETLEAVVNARAKATSITVDPSKSTPEQMKAFQEAQSGLSQSLGKLLLITENYPQLQANSNFKELQVQLEGTENRIKVERDRYNDEVTAYNKKVRKFPASFFASIFGFGDKTQFEAQEGSENAPQVEF